MTGISAERSGSIPSTSSWMLQQSAEGEQDAWRKLTSVYGPVVYRWVRGLGVRSDDIPDVVQEVFLALYRGLGQYQRSQGSFRNWLFVVTRNTTFSFHRRHGKADCAEGGTSAWKRQQDVSYELPADADASYVPSTVLQQAMELLRSRFQDRTWKAAWRVLVDGQDASRVAAEMEMTVAAVYTAKSRVLACLRSELHPFED